MHRKRRLRATCSFTSGGGPGVTRLTFSDEYRAARDYLRVQMEAEAARNRVMLRAVHSGMPVVAVGRGNNEGFTPPRDRYIGGRNLTSTKARILFMAALLKLGALPPAADPANPTADELDAIRGKLSAYQEIFDSH